LLNAFCLFSGAEWTDEKKEKKGKGKKDGGKGGFARFFR